MPRYKYYCQDCDTNFLVFHSMSEEQEECVQCLGNNITKSVTSPSYIEKKNVQQKVGALTNKHIEESRMHFRLMSNYRLLSISPP